MEYDEDQLRQAVSFLMPICDDMTVPYAIRNEVCVAIGRIENALQFRFEWDESKRNRWYELSFLKRPKVSR